MTKITHNSRKLSALLMVGASGLALTTPAQANDFLFTSSDKPLAIGERMTQTEALTQVSLTGGGTASFTDNAEYQINADGSIDLYAGTVTVAGNEDNPVIVRMPEGLEGRVSGRGSSGNFSVQPNGQATGHALTGVVEVGLDNRFKKYRAGAMWSAAPGARPNRVIANAAQTMPDATLSAPAVVAIGDDAGPVAAASNGIPVTLGEALAAAGASSDILAAARRLEANVGNPTLDTFPSGDLALLITRAAQIEGAFGGSPFPQAQADIIRTYLRFLANNGGASAGAQFLSTFSAFSLDYLDLIRVGGVPSSFASAGQADINAYLAFIDRTGTLAQLSAQDRVLANAYLAFLRDGGNVDLFASSFTDLTDAYFAFVRAGNDPDAFAGASAAVLAQTIAFLSDSGLTAQLSAADQALVAAFLQNGGLAFTGQFQSALDDYFAFLAAGRLPSEYEPVDQATLRQFLETLSDTGLLNAVLGDQAQFYADYLTFLRAGGDVDAFAGLPVNIFTDYAAQLSAYRAFLDAGNLPSAFDGGDPAQLQAFIAELQAAGALNRFVSADANFFAAFAAFVNMGGEFDAFAGLNANIFSGYATELQAYFAFLAQGGVPSTYEPLSQDVIAQYLAELQAADAKARFLPELAEFYAAYFAFISDGGNPDTFAGLPVPPDFGAFAAALNAYADFLAAGGFPAEFADTDLSVLASFIESLNTAGELEQRLGANADLLQAYFAFLAGGGAPNAFAGLPIYADYVTALNQYFAFLADGGLPTDYTVLDQTTLNTFLAALRDAQGGLTGFGNLNTFFAEYAAFVLAGRDPAAFAGLPVYAQYVVDLNAYFAFLANGGLPSDYTVLSQDVLNAYLAALSGTQVGLGGFGDLNAFFADYAAFVLAGGDPVTFAGLPVFTQYIADLNAYFAFLADGGVPSEYTVLSQDILNAYLALLAGAQGGLTGFAALNQFFIDYFAFLQGGGNVDLFAGLPVNMGGGGTGGGDPGTRPTLAYEGGFNVNNARVSFRGADRVNNSIISLTDDLLLPGNSLQIGADGAFGEVRDNRRDRYRNVNATAIEINGNENFLIGRFVDGLIDLRGRQFFLEGNESVHYLLAAPFDPGATLLRDGATIFYDLLAATSPTIADGSLAPGVFDARLGLQFGASTILAGIEGTVALPDAGGDLIYTISAGTGLDDTSGWFPLPTFPADRSVFDIRFDAASNKDTCNTNQCFFLLTGAFSGSSRDQIGSTYRIVTGRGNENSISGAAIFGASADQGSGGGSGGGTSVPAGTGTPLILDFANEFAATDGVKYNVSAAAFSLSGFDLPTFTLAANGALTSTSDGVNTRGIGTSTATDISGNSRFLIGRWTDGEYETSSTSEDSVLTSAQGFHYLLAGPTTSDFELPAMGSIQYELIAATAPTIQDGSLSPGQFEAEMIVLFGSAPTVAMEGSITLPTSGDDYVYSFASTGGIANPDQSDNEFRVRFSRNVNFEFRGDQITTSDNSCDETCVIQFAGYFAGDDALELGVTYTAQTGTLGKNISGAAIFGNGVLDDGSDTMTLAGGVEDFDTSVLVTAAISYGEEGFTRTSRTNQTDVSADGVLNSIGSFGRGNAVGDQIIGDEYAIIGRWINGDVVFPTGARSYTTTENDSSHWAIASVVSRDFTLSGDITYDLLGATTPTYSDGRTAPGSFDGSLVINWQSPTQIGLDFAGEVTMPDAVYAWSFQSPNFATRLQGVFESNATIDGTACENNGCQAAVSYQFGGANLGERFAINYNISLFREDLDIGGSALFGAPGSFDPANYPGTADTSAVQSRTVASIAPSVVPATMTGGEWARWGGSGSASPQGVAPIKALVPPGVEAPNGRTITPAISREAAIRQAEALMGGAITFGRPTGSVRAQ